MCVHHPLLLGLQEAVDVAAAGEGGPHRLLGIDEDEQVGQATSALFVHDSEDEIRAKVRKAFCPPDSAQFNPMLDWVRKLIFPRDGEFRVARTPEHGGDLRFRSPEEVDEAYLAGALHPADLKNGVADWLVDTLEPAPRRSSGPAAALLDELEALTHLTMQPLRSRLRAPSGADLDAGLASTAMPSATSSSGAAHRRRAAHARR